MKYKVDIILPVYKEEDNISHVLQGIKKHVKTPHRIFTIWQDEKDPTIPVLHKLKKQYQNLKIIQSDYGLGMLPALKTGFKHATSELVLIMMSDRSDNPVDIEKLIKKIDNGADVACASRYSKGGKRIGGPKLKAFLSWFACWSLRLLTGIPTSDATNAFKCFRNDVLKKIKLESKGGFEMPMELVVKAHKLGYKIDEIPTIWREREKGVSKFDLQNLIPYYLRWYLYAFK